MTDQLDLGSGVQFPCGISRITYVAALRAAFVKGGRAMWRDQVLVSLSEERATAALQALAEAEWPDG